MRRMFEGVEAERLEAVRLARRPHRVEHRPGVARVAEDLVAELAGEAGARDDDRRAVEGADAADREAEPAELLERGLRRRGPDDLLQDVAALRALHGDVVQLVRRGAHPGLQAELLRLLAHPDARQVAAADPAEIVLAEPEDGAVVDHAAVLVGDGGVDDLADRELLHVAGDAGLDQLLRVRPRHLVLAQGREVHDGGVAPAGPVFLDRAEPGELLRQPVAVVLDEVAGVGGEARLEARLLRHLQVGIGGHAESLGLLEALFLVVDADLDVGGLPPVGGVDVGGARGGDAHEVGRRAQQHEVARPGPRLVRHERVLVVDHRVVEEVGRRPARPRLEPVGFHLGVDVVGAVHVAGIAHVVVVAGKAGEPERIVPADRVLDHLDERLLVHREVLGVRAGLGIGRAHQAARRRRVDVADPALLERAHVERLEVRALAALHVEDLDVLPGLHLVGLREARQDVEVGQRVGERRGRGDPALQRPRVRPADIEHDLRRGRLLRDVHRAAGRGDDEQPVRGGEEALAVARPRGSALEGAGAARRAEIEAAPRQRRLHALRRLLAGGEERLQAVRLAGVAGADHRGIRLAGLGEEDELARLQPLAVDDGDLVARLDHHGARAAARHGMPLHARRQDRDARRVDGAAPRRRLEGRPDVHVGWSFHERLMSCRESARRRVACEEEFFAPLPQESWPMLRQGRRRRG